MDSHIVSVVISAAALVVSILSAVAVYRVQRFQAHVQERVLELDVARERDRFRELRKARLTARIIQYGRDYHLVITNKGRGPARHVKTQMDGIRLSENPRVWDVDRMNEVTELGPSAETDYLLMNMDRMTDYNIVTVEIAWDDDSGEPGTWRSQLKL